MRTLDKIQPCKTCNQNHNIDDMEDGNCYACHLALKNNWGGSRIPGPGKKIGRPAGINNKIPVSFTLDINTKSKLTMMANKLGKSRSEIVESLINDKFDA